MSTDATVEVQRRHGDTWVCVERDVIARDLALFALFSDIRWPAEPVVPVRDGAVRWPGATEDDPDSTWLWPDEVATVLETHLARGGRPPTRLAALLASARALQDQHPSAVRLAFRFF